MEIGRSHISDTYRSIDLGWDFENHLIVHSYTFEYHLYFYQVFSPLTSQYFTLYSILSFIKKSGNVKSRKKAWRTTSDFRSNFDWRQNMLHCRPFFAVFSLPCHILHLEAFCKLYMLYTIQAKNTLALEGLSWQTLFSSAASAYPLSIHIHWTKTTLDDCITVPFF